MEHEIFGFGKLILYDLASLFRDMDWKNHKTHWYEAVSSALSIIEGSLAELLRF